MLQRPAARHRSADAPRPPGGGGASSAGGGPVLNKPLYPPPTLAQLRDEDGTELVGLHAQHLSIAAAQHRLGLIMGAKYILAENGDQTTTIDQYPSPRKRRRTQPHQAGVASHPLQPTS